MQRTTRALSFAITCLVALAALVANAGSASPASAAPPAQDVMSLDRRISAIEQRFYTIESSINQLQLRVQSTERHPGTPAASRDPEVDRLLAELSLLQSRLGELECGVLKLDERTLPAAARAQQPKPTDPCRSQANTPVRLSSRRQ